jgi:hypothetical protein
MEKDDGYVIFKLYFEYLLHTSIDGDRQIHEFAKNVFPNTYFGSEGNIGSVSFSGKLFIADSLSIYCCHSGKFKSLV